MTITFGNKIFDAITWGIFLVLSLSTLIGVLDFFGAFPKIARKFLRLNRADDTLTLLKELGIDIDKYKRSNEKFRYPHDSSIESIKETTAESLKDHTISRKVSVGRRRKTEVPYYIDLIGATCDSNHALYYANLLSSYWHTELNNRSKIPHYEFDFVVTPKDGSPILGYEFSKLINKPFVLHESNKRFSGFEEDMRSFFDCESVPKKGSTALIVDDSTTGGTMICKVIDDLRKYGYNIYTVLVVFEPQPKDARSRLKEKQVDLVSITYSHEKNKKRGIVHVNDKNEYKKNNEVDNTPKEKHLSIVFGNSERFFINFQIGCNFECKYCYLPKISEYTNPTRKRYSVEEVYDMVMKNPGFTRGKDGTILSFGCYSECWCDETRESTIELMCKLAEFGNPMQLSTKMRIKVEDILRVDNTLLYENQLIINISMPTITHAAFYEPGTDIPTERISILDRKGELKNIKFVLYIRPVIDTITVQDILLYGNLMKQYSVPCIVGDYFVMDDFNNTAYNYGVGEGLLIETEPKDLKKLSSELSKYGQVYRHSTELIKR